MDRCPLFPASEFRIRTRQFIEGCDRELTGGWWSSKLEELWAELLNIFNTSKTISNRYQKFTRNPFLTLIHNLKERNGYNAFVEMQLKRIACQLAISFILGHNGVIACVRKPIGTVPLDPYKWFPTHTTKYQIDPCSGVNSAEGINFRKHLRIDWNFPLHATFPEDGSSQIFSSIVWLQVKTRFLSLYSPTSFLSSSFTVSHYCQTITRRW